MFGGTSRRLANPWPMWQSVSHHEVVDKCFLWIVFRVAVVPQKTTRRLPRLLRQEYWRPGLCLHGTSCVEVHQQLERGTHESVDWIVVVVSEVGFEFSVSRPNLSEMPLIGFAVLGSNWNYGRRVSLRAWLGSRLKMISIDSNGWQRDPTWTGLKCYVHEIYVSNVWWKKLCCGCWNLKFCICVLRSMPSVTALRCWHTPWKYAYNAFQLPMHLYEVQVLVPRTSWTSMTYLYCEYSTCTTKDNSREVSISVHAYVHLAR